MKTRFLKKSLTLLALFAFCAAMNATPHRHFRPVSHCPHRTIVKKHVPVCKDCGKVVNKKKIKPIRKGRHHHKRHAHATRRL